MMKAKLYNKPDNNLKISTPNQMQKNIKIDAMKLQLGALLPIL